jgi:hypothetical protein
VHLVGFYYKNTKNIVANILISRAENHGNDFANCTQDVAVECDDFLIALPVNTRNKKTTKISNSSKTPFNT